MTLKTIAFVIILICTYKKNKKIKVGENQLSVVIIIPHKAACAQKKMETQKIVYLLNDSNNESSKFATRKWYIINDQNNRQYGRGNENNSTIKFETKVIKPNLCDYSDAYILVTGDIKVSDVAAGNNVAFKNCAQFTRCVTHINELI